MFMFYRDCDECPTETSNKKAGGWNHIHCTLAFLSRNNMKKNMFHLKRDIFIANFVVTSPFVPLYILALENSTSFLPSPFVPVRRTRDQHLSINDRGSSQRHSLGSRPNWSPLRLFKKTAAWCGGPIHPNCEFLSRYSWLPIRDFLTETRRKSPEVLGKTQINMYTPSGWNLEMIGSIILI